MHENFCKHDDITHHYYPLATLQKITNCPSCLGQQHSLVFNTFFPCKRGEQICSDDCQVLWKQILINLLMNLRRNVSSYLSIYLVVSWIVFLWKPNTIPSNPGTHLCHLQWSLRACPMACTEYPNIISLLWIEYCRQISSVKDTTLVYFSIGQQ